MSKLLEAYTKYMRCQIECAKDKAHKDPGVKPFVTISRQAGAGATSVAEKLIDYLSAHDPKTPCPWTVFDKALVKQTLEEHKLRYGAVHI